MTINSSIQTGRPTVSGLVGNLRSKNYFVDNSFQRRLVWTEKQKVRLIETILLGYPMPEIYLWQQEADPDSGDQRHSVVDGQQRLTSMQQFISNEWPLKKSSLEIQDSFYVDKYWKDLKKNEKQIMWDYVVNARMIPPVVSKDEIRKIFSRLNETDKSLNPQEMRNAQFTGKFIEVAETVANLNVWREWGFFTDSQIRRMADIEFSSSLLIYLRSGVVSDSSASINKMYDLYNDEYNESEDDLKHIKQFISRTKKYYFKNDAVSNFFAKPVHLYSLFVVDDMLGKEKWPRSRVTPFLARFVKVYEGKNSDVVIEQYREGASYRTRSKSARIARVDNLYDWITDKLV